MPPPPRLPLAHSFLLARIVIWVFSYILFFSILAASGAARWELTAWLGFGVVVGVLLSGVVQNMVLTTVDRPLAQRLAIVTACVLVVTIVNAVIDVATLGQAMSAPERRRPLLYLLSGVQSFSFLIWIHAFIAACVWVMKLSVDMMAKERRLAAAESEAQKATLRALRAQINPHFLFNALNAAASLVATGRNAEAEEVIVRLSEFFRSSLASEPEAVIPLSEEFAILESYLQIEQVRFPDRLSVRLELPPELEGARVPSFLLQPLAENAVKHAVSPSTRPVCVTIRAHAESDRLHLTVIDDGAGASSNAATIGEGVGLDNVAQRLLALHGANASMHVDSSDIGFRVDLDIPLELQLGDGATT